jgi:hypothetical protein
MSTVVQSYSRRLKLIDEGTDPDFVRRNGSGHLP